MKAEAKKGGYGKVDRESLIAAFHFKQIFFKLCSRLFFEFKILKIRKDSFFVLRKLYNFA